MPDSSISQLSEADALVGSELVAVVQGGTTKKDTLSSICNYFIDDGATWGNITGTLADQTDLQGALVPGNTVPVNAAAASVTTGSGNARVAWTAATPGTDGNDITVVTTDDAGSAVTLAVESGDAITVTRAAKARMKIAADFGSGLEEDVELFYAGEINGGPYWSSGVYLLYYDGSDWVLEKDGVQFTSTTTEAFPDTASGTVWPVVGQADVNAISSSASQVKAAADADLTIVAATLPGTGSHTFAAVSPAESLSGGVDATPTPPYMRVTGDKLYVQDGGIWKEAELSALS